MKHYFITIDTGTTNTRTILWDDNKTIVAKASSETGVRNTAIDGNNNKLKEAVRGCLQQMLTESHLTFDDIERVVASGMITSNVGLYELPHAFAPAGIPELAAGCHSVMIEDVCPLPILFVPGVKNPIHGITTENFEAMDIMRGEEVESIAMLDRFPKDQPYLLVLPGSHTKFVSTNAAGQITGCLTTMAGELLSVLTTNTIIADAVDRSFVSADSYERDMVLLGYDTARKAGIGRAAFSTRILNMFTDKPKASLANYLLGVVLSSDIEAIMGSDALPISPDMTVIVSGKDPLRQAICDILQHAGYFKHVETFTPDPSLPLSALGAMLVTEQVAK